MTALGGDARTRGPARLARLWLPILALFTIYNLEEIILDLPAWGRAQGVVIPTTQTDQFGFALVVAGLSVFVFALAYFLRRNAGQTSRLLTVFLGFMLANFVWHVGASAVTTSLQPGAISSVLLAPVYGWLLWRVLTTRSGDAGGAGAARQTNPNA